MSIVREIMSGRMPKKPEPPKPDTVEDLLDEDFEDHVDCHQHRREVVAGIADCDKEIADYTALRAGLVKELADLDASLADSNRLYAANPSTSGKRIFRNGVAFRLKKTAIKEKKAHPGAGIFKVID